MKQWLDRIRPGTVGWILVAIGIAIRAKDYLANRSLWLDEAKLAHNLITRTPSQLFLPLDHFQGAPIGFLLVQKLVITLFGPSEFALRLIPFIAGVSTLLLFRIVARKCLKPWPAVFAIAILVFSSEAIYYSSEAKKYALDLLCSVAIVLAGIRCIELRNRVLPLIVFCAIVLVSYVLAISSVFAVGGALTAMFLTEIEKRDWRGTIRVAAAGLFLIAVFLVYLFGFLAPLMRAIRITLFSPGHFLPWPPASLADLLAIGSRFTDIFGDPMGCGIEEGAFILFTIGCFSLIRKNRALLAIILLPILLAAIPGFIGYYPFRGRFLLYAVPLQALGIALGAYWMLGRQTKVCRTAGMVLAGIVMLAILVHAAIEGVFWLPVHEETRNIVQYAHDNLEPGDLVYHSNTSNETFWYYMEGSGQFDFGDSQIIQGAGRYLAPWDFESDVKKLENNPRVWVLLSHMNNREEIQEEKLFLGMLDGAGIRLEEFKAEDASAYLYDMRNE